MDDCKVKKRDKFSKLKNILKSLLLGKECRPSQSMTIINDDSQEIDIANYLTPLIKTNVVEKKNTGIYGLNEQLINRDYFQNVNHVSNFVSSTLCQMKPKESEEVFEYFFQQIPKNIIKSMIYQSLTDCNHDDFINSCLLSERYKIFHKMHAADFKVKLTIRYKENNNIHHKLIVPLKSFIIIDILYLCFYDVITKKIDFLEYHSIDFYRLDKSEIPYFHISEEGISKAISNFQEKNMQELKSISFIVFPELMITLSHLKLIDDFENIQIPDEKNFEKEELKHRTSSGICKFIAIPKIDICYVNTSLKPSIFDLADNTDSEFTEFATKQEKKAFRIYAPKINLVYIIRNYFEHIKLIDYSDIEEELHSFITTILKTKKDYE